VLYTVSETFPILRRIQPDIITNVHRSSCKEAAFLARLNKLGFSGQIFEKSSNVTCHKNLSSGSWDVAREKTDKQTDMRKLIVVYEILWTSLKT
jgi:hypothetical protein